MQELRVERRFSASPQEVWDVYTDHARWNEWAGMSVSRLAREGAPDRNGVGCVRELGSAGALAVEEVLSFEPPKRMTYTVRGGPLPVKDHLGEVDFEPDGDGTRVVWRCRFASKIPGLGPLLRIAITVFFRRALEGLAREKLPDRP